MLAREVKLPASKLNSDQALEKYGIDSMMIMNVTHDLEESFGLLPKTLFFEYLNISELAQYFVEHHASKISELAAKTPAHPFTLQTNGHKNGHSGASANGNGKSNGNGNATRHSNGNGNGHYSTKIAEFAATSRDEDIAIIGIAGRYPGANTPDEFWQNLKSGKDSISRDTVRSLGP